jgi:hypothetical protein
MMTQQPPSDTPLYSFFELTRSSSELIHCPQPELRRHIPSYTSIEVLRLMRSFGASNTPLNRPTSATYISKAPTVARHCSRLGPWAHSLLPTNGNVNVFSSGVGFCLTVDLVDKAREHLASASRASSWPKAPFSLLTIARSTWRKIS